MSQDHNLFSNTSYSAGSSNLANSFNTTGSFNNNTNFGNNNSNCGNTNTTSNVYSVSVPDDRSEILAWLSPLEPSSRHHSIGEGRVEGVGGWLLQTEDFRSWCNGSSHDGSHKATIFCYGNPGAGKTFVNSLVVDTLCNEARGQDIAVTCFYFDFAAEKDQTPSNMLGALLRQMVGGMDKIPGEITQAFEEQRKVIGGRKLQLDQIVKMLETVMSLQRTYICIDAVDECAAKYRGKILSSLHEIMKRSPATRLFLTGRPHVRSEVETSLPGGTAAVLISPRRGDVIHYIRAKLEEDVTPDEMDERLKEEIVKRIPDTVLEIFLLVSLNLEAILQEPTIHRRREKLRLMTEGPSLEGAYSATIARIKAHGGERSRLGMAALMWICHSERPMEADELRHALAVEIGSTNFNPENAPSIKTVLSCCHGLVAMDKRGSRVRLIHFTLQEYLSSHPDLFQRAHSVMAETCLTYLNSQQVMRLSAILPHNLQVTPFLKYSSLYWGSHAKKEPSDPVKISALKLFGQYDNHISIKLLFELNTPIMIRGPRGFSSFKGLHCASFFGLVDVVTALIQMESRDINQTDLAGCTPLLWAAQDGHEQVVEILLRCSDVNPNKPDMFRRTPLSRAAKRGYEGVVRLLLGRSDVNPNEPDGYGRTPLSDAAWNGYEGVVRLLLGRSDVNPNKPDRYGQTPLSYAAWCGCEGVVRLLLGRSDVNPDKPDDQDRTPLSYAANSKCERVMQLFLGRSDVNPGKPDRYGRTPLSYAAWCGCEGVVRLLLGRSDVNPDKPDEVNRTPLSYAAGKGHEGVVRLLLGRSGVDPDKPDQFGRTPLFHAARNGHEGVVQMHLGRSDVKPDRSDKFGRTPLLYAAGNGCEGVVRLLLGRSDVNPNKPDRYGQTPLFHASGNGHGRIVLLLQACAPSPSDSA